MRPLLFIAALVLSQAAFAQGLHRYAVVVGNDEGGEGTRPLLYARDDAKRIKDILVRLGGVSSADTLLVLNGTADDFLSALSTLERRAQAASVLGERTALFVYFSGHAKDGALRLGDTALPLEALKDRLAHSPVDVRIGIFDACRSGAITRTKGARRAPQFEVDTNAARAAKGLVLLTSSASDEDSQESDQLHGSYFSHHLASGLLGDADRSGDGRVTLSEAYTYAYDRTVADTADSAAGAQHPTFSYDLAGNGDVVLTDLVSRNEGLLFPSRAPAGVYYLVDGRGAVVAEVNKLPDTERLLALPPGSYRIKRRLADHLRVGEITVAQGGRVIVEESRLHDAPFSDDPVKGAGPTVELDLGFSGAYQLSFDPPERGGYLPSSGMLGAELVVHSFFGRGWGLGFDTGIGASKNTLQLTGLSVPMTSQELQIGSSILREGYLGTVRLFAGVRLAMLVTARQVPDAGPVGDQIGLTWTPGVTGGISVPLFWGFNVLARARVHYVMVPAIQDTRSIGYVDAGVLLGHTL